MMWVFDVRIAELRKTHHILVKVITDNEDSTLGRRCAKILKTDSPKVHPLSELEDSLVEIEYTDNKRRLKQKFVPVRNLTISDPTVNQPHVIFDGSMKGTVVRHMRTEGDLAKVKPEGSKKNIKINGSIQCQLQLAV